MGLLYGENCMILTSTFFDWSTRVTDGQTDGIAIAYARLAYMLSHAKIKCIRVFTIEASVWNHDLTAAAAETDVMVLGQQNYGRFSSVFGFLHAAAITIGGIRRTYPWRDGQAELVSWCKWLRWIPWTVARRSSNPVWRGAPMLCFCFMLLVMDDWHWPKSTSGHILCPWEA